MKEENEKYAPILLLPLDIFVCVGIVEVIDGDHIVPPAPAVPEALNIGRIFMPKGTVRVNNVALVATPTARSCGWDA